MYSFSIFFSDEYLIVRATENLKNLSWVGFFGEMGAYIKNLIMQFCCALSNVLLYKISSFSLELYFLPSISAILGDWGSYQKTI